jgi:hypothetical protein
LQLRSFASLASSKYTKKFFASKVKVETLRMLKLYLYFVRVSKCVQMFENLETKCMDLLIHVKKATV